LVMVIDITLVPQLGGKRGVIQTSFERHDSERVKLSFIGLSAMSEAVR